MPYKYEQPTYTVQLAAKFFRQWPNQGTDGTYW